MSVSPDTIVLIRERSERWFRRLMRELEGLDDAAALQGATNSWPGHRFGIGQNGSIAGIVYHIATWKALTLPVLTGEDVLPMEDFDRSLAPDIADWPGIRAWVQDMGQQWNTALYALPDERFDDMAPWESGPIPIVTFLMEMIDHDVQHCSQIEYIKQLQHVTNGARE